MFWIVMADEAKTQVSRRHLSELDARLEAERLARQTGKRFYVLAVIGSAFPSAPPITWEPITDGLVDLPF